MATSIIGIGNPGAGKSTILNGLAREILFKSGISIGNGLTYQLDERKNEEGTFFDTPGLADDTHRAAAGEAISTALRRGGNFKILFFVLTESGRIVVQDVTTITLVLDAVPEIENHYGIVINKVPNNVAKALQNSKTEDIFLTKLFAGIPEERRCAKSNVTYLPFHSEFHEEEDKLIDLNDLKTLNGGFFKDFAYDQVPTINLTVGKAGDIATDKFDQMNSTLEALQKKLDSDRETLLEQQNLLQAQLEEAEAEKIEQQKRDKELHEEQLALMQQQLIQKEKEKEAARIEAERLAKFQEEQRQIQLQQQQKEHEAQIAAEQARLAEIQAQNNRRRKKHRIGKFRF